MHSDSTMNDLPKLELPEDLVAELQRRGSAPKVDMRMDAWNETFLGKIASIFSGKK